MSKLCSKKNKNTTQEIVLNVKLSLIKVRPVTHLQVPASPAHRLTGAPLFIIGVTGGGPGQVLEGRQHNTRRVIYDGVHFRRGWEEDSPRRATPVNYSTPTLRLSLHSMAVQRRRKATTGNFENLASAMS